MLRVTPLPPFRRRIITQTTPKLAIPSPSTLLIQVIPPAQPPYAAPYGATPPASSQWPAQPNHAQQQQQQQGGYQGGRHRGGWQNDRGVLARARPGGQAAIETMLPAQPPLARLLVILLPALPTQIPTHQFLTLSPLPKHTTTRPPPPPAAVAASAGSAGRHDPYFGHSHGHDQPAHGKKKKRKVNTLGLTPGDVSGSEEDDDDGEEKKLSDLMGNEVIEIPDMAAYIAERRKRYPTKARVEAKKATEASETQQADEETSRLEREADKLRRQLKKVESSIKRKREQQDEGDEMRDPTPEEGSDNDKPEVQSSRVREAAIREKEANNGQLTIKQRLILNDKEQEDLAVLESIQYLREKGLVKTTPAVKLESPSSAQTSPNKPSKSQKPAGPTTSTLPAPPLTPCPT
ncbi:unnamed protein product [Parascedosporium putredinis]|uniref:FMR1-interacting protein 1 conserved domain-containing protein n=1 Tax=Parascedosporium putredinis TaxID=1442378 RepID=A0A9P1M9V9_9PEZI|nr:unnamed protein product [Parascedosporium putredinis]CAI7992810.1 unnamed protein product [Parascedosporium putredinis]